MTSPEVIMATTTMTGTSIGTEAMTAATITSTADTDNSQASASRSPTHGRMIFEDMAKSERPGNG